MDSVLRPFRRVLYPVTEYATTVNSITDALEVTLTRCKYQRHSSLNEDRSHLSDLRLLKIGEVERGMLEMKSLYFHYIQ